MTEAAASVIQRLFAGGPVLSDGAMGTMLLERGVPLDRCYEEMNLLQPELVGAIHAEYLDAGAEIVEANTFGANAFRLARHGFSNQVRAVNLAGVRIARELVGARTACVAGAIGPLGVDVRRMRSEEVRAAFVEQVSALAEGEPDLLMIETMTSIVEAEEALSAARDVDAGLGVIVMVTVDDAGDCLDGTTAEEAAVRLTDLGADAVGCNCSMGPESVLQATRRMRVVTGAPLAALPSVGVPGGNLAAPFEFANRLKQTLAAGASLVGGCCGTTPEHIRAARLALVPLPPLDR